MASYTKVSPSIFSFQLELGGISVRPLKQPEALGAFYKPLVTMPLLAR